MVAGHRAAGSCRGAGPAPGERRVDRDRHRRLAVPVGRHVRRPGDGGRGDDRRCGWRPPSPTRSPGTPRRRPRRRPASRPSPAGGWCSASAAVTRRSRTSGWRRRRSPSSSTTCSDCRATSGATRCPSTSTPTPTGGLRSSASLGMRGGPTVSRLRWLRDGQPKVPVDVAASGPRVIEVAARLADAVTFAVGADPDRLRLGRRHGHRGAHRRRSGCRLASGSARTSRCSCTTTAPSPVAWSAVASARMPGSP